MFINAGARSLLLEGERHKFLKEEWPRVYETIQRLGLKPEELLNGGSRRASSEAPERDVTESDRPESKSPQEER
jgi:GntR family transcriptional regulator